MQQIMNYIFSSLETSNDNFKLINANFTAIKEAIIKQNILNKLTSISLLVTSYTLYKTLKEYNTKIEDLEREIKTLKKQQDPVEYGE